jgi:GAF domain-containing protein
MVIKVDADPLEGMTFSTVDTAAPNPEAQAAAEAEAQQQAQALQAIEAGIMRVVYFGLRAVRGAIARRMPEIMDEWPDPVLQGPAEASVPLLRRHMEKLSQIAGANPELTVFALSLVPLGMGYIAAAEKNSRTVEDATPKSTEEVQA